MRTPDPSQIARPTSRAQVLAIANHAIEMVAEPRAALVEIAISEAPITENDRAKDCETARLAILPSRQSNSTATAVFPISRMRRGDTIGAEIHEQVASIVTPTTDSAHAVTLATLRNKHALGSLTRKTKPRHSVLELYRRLHKLA